MNTQANPLMPVLKSYPITDYDKSVLNQQQIRSLLVHLLNDDWFMSTYQSRAFKKTPEAYTLRTLLEAVKNSEERFQQYPVDDRNLKRIARSIFVEELWLMRDITLAFFDNQPYIIGGRHRVTAIANVLASWVRQEHTEEDWEDNWELALEQHVRCEVLYLQTIHDLLALVQADNESRTMRKAEQSHMMLQSLGADATSVEAVGKTVLGSELDPKEAITLAAQSFTRRPESHLKNQTKQVIGEKIARYILFGAQDGKLYKSAELKIDSVGEFERRMNRAWEILKGLVEGEEIVAKYATSYSDRVIAKLQEEELEANKERAEVLHQKHQQGELELPTEPVFTATPKRGRKAKTEG